MERTEAELRLNRDAFLGWLLLLAVGALIWLCGWVYGSGFVQGSGLAVLVLLVPAGAAVFWDACFPASGGATPAGILGAEVSEQAKRK